MNKQTAVEWLGYELNTKLFYDITPELWEQVNEIFNKALDMEQEQIIEAYQAGDGDAYNLQDTELWGQEYYNETYGVKGRENKTFMSEEEWVKEYTGEKGRDIGESEYGDYI